MQRHGLTAGLLTLAEETVGPVESAFAGVGVYNANVVLSGRGRGKDEDEGEDEGPSPCVYSSLDGDCEHLGCDLHLRA